MLYIFSGFVVAINLFVAMIKKNSKIISFCLIILMCVLMGANTNNPDYNTYETIFNLGAVPPDPGFFLIIKLFRFLGLNYETFRLVLSIFGIVLIHQTLNKLTSNYSYFYVLYFIFPFFIDIVQIRNFLEMAIMIYAMPFLLQDTLKGYIKYTILIIFAASIQITAILYLLFLLINIVKRFTIIKYIFVIVIISAITISLNRSFFIGIVNQLSTNFGYYDERINYYSEVLTRNGYFFYWGVQLCFLYITKILFSGTNNLKNQNVIEGKREMQINKLTQNENYVNSFCELVFWANIISLIFMPTYVLQALYFRLFRNLVPLNYIAIISSLQYLPPKSLKKITITLALFGLSIVLFYVDIGKPFYETIIIKIFENNWVFR